MKKLILIKEAKNRAMIFDKKYIILKEIEKFSHGFPNFIFQNRYFAD